MAMVPAVPVFPPGADAGGELRHPLGPWRHRRTGRHPQHRQLPPPRQESRGSQSTARPYYFFRFELVIPGFYGRWIPSRKDLPVNLVAVLLGS
jgi:hypothetical protein